MHKPASHLIATLIALGFAAPLAAAPYKWIDEDGRVTYGDRPPMGGSARLLSGPTRTPATPAATAPAASAGTPATATAAAAPADQNLPTLLKTLAGRNPVVLYTGRDCAPCASARTHLGRRGVPFVEKTVGTEGDLEAFKKIGFSEMTVPALGVGAARLSGYEASAWDRALDAGGYPKSSLLPPDYKAPGAEPLAGERPGGGRVVERITKERPSAIPAAAVLDAPPLQGSGTSTIRF